jgi:hypothetical protein
MTNLRKCIEVAGPVRPVPEPIAFESLDGERLWWLRVWYPIWLLGTIGSDGVLLWLFGSVPYILYELGGRGAVRFFMLPEELPACHITDIQTLSKQD